MIVSLIPFFLVARIGHDESSWPNGPEFVFDVRANITATRSTQNTDVKTNDVQGYLHCRPKGMEVLSCHVKNIRPWYVIHEDSNEDKSSERKWTSNRTENLEYPFEIKFNNRGIEYLIVNRRMHVLHANMIKTIVEQLSIGEDLNGKPDGSFEAFQTSSEGQCEATFTISHQPFKNPRNRLSRLEYELESLPQLNKVPGETIELEKSRNLDNCTQYADMYYGVYGSTRVDSRVEPRLAASTTRIYISDTDFESTTIREGTSSSMPEKNYNVVETITVKLKNIQAANGVLRVIQNPGRTTILANDSAEKL